MISFTLWEFLTTFLVYANADLARMTVFSSQLDTEKILSTLFASNARVVILRIFLIDPLRAYYQRQLEQATGLAIRAVQRELERLVSIGLLFRHVEGNRTYHQVDMDFPLYPELREIILKAGSDFDRLRSRLAVNPAIRLAFLNAGASRVLVVLKAGQSGQVEAPPYTVEVVASATFVAWLGEKNAALQPFLVDGVDLLGRRDDVIWRRIEASGYSVTKGDGIP